MNYSELNSITRNFLVSGGKTNNTISESSIEAVTSLLQEVINTSPNSSFKLNQAIEKLQNIQRVTSNLENKISILERKLELLEEK